MRSADDCKAQLLERFKGRMHSFRVLNGNELHFIVEKEDDVPDICASIQDDLKGKLATMFCTDERRLAAAAFVLRYVFGVAADGADLFITAEVRIGQDEPSSPPCFPSIALRLPIAALYEREIRDMFGLQSRGAYDSRTLVLHDEWPSGVHPLKKDFDGRTKVPRVQGPRYEFLRVGGEGVSEIPVGPVHAGIIEPGHFRFSVLGDTIVALESRLYYTHRGVEKLAESMRLGQALLLSERISGDEAVANSTAFCQAIERISSTVPPKRALQVRALCAEMERIYNHLGTLGGLSTDVGFAYGSARLNILKERMMRLNEEVAGSRLLFGVNRIGGVGIELPPERAALVGSIVVKVRDDFHRVVKALRDDSSVVDRLRGTGTISHKTASQMSLVGVAARSSGLDTDTRKEHPYGIYGKVIPAGQGPARRAIQHQVEMAKRRGDVFARFETRIEEVDESIRLIEAILGDMDGDPALTAPVAKDALQPFSHALGYAESHRGETMHWVMVGSDGDSLFRYKVRTASFANWPAIDVAVLNDIVADFPLVNKSLDLSYAGNDL